MIKVGSKVKDSITGFTGIVIARTEWLYGCVRLTVEPIELIQGKPVDAHSFDEQRLELLEEKKPEVSKDSRATTGGPHDDPKPLPSPTR